MAKPTKKQINQQLQKNIRRMKKLGWTDQQIESYKRGWFKKAMSN